MTDHAEVLRQIAASYREDQKRADDRADELAAAVRAAYNDPDHPLRKAEILRATGHVWSRTWLDKVLSTTPKTEVRPVVVAVIAGDLGVLIAKRNDGTPPWTFPGGEQRPDESPNGTVQREVQEETGLLIAAETRELGRRNHPRTGRSMVYLAATVVGDPDAIVVERDDLAEVKWASLEEAERLMPDMFEPAREYLRRELAG